MNSNLFSLPLLLCAFLASAIISCDAAKPVGPDGRIFAPAIAHPVRTANTDEFLRLREQLVAGDLRGNYPIEPNGTYGAIFLENGTVPGQQGAQWIQFPSLFPAKGPYYQYWLGAVFVTFQDDTHVNVTLVLYVESADGSQYGFLPPVQMFGRYVIGGLTTPSTIMIGYNGPNQCLEGPIAMYNISRYWCCYPSCPTAMDYVQNFYQLSVAYKADNTTDFITIGNPGEQFAGLPYTTPLLCLTPPCARLTIAPNAVGAVCVDGQCIGGNVWSSLKSLLRKVLMYFASSYFR